MPILLDTRNSFKRETKRSLDKEAQLGIGVVMWLGMDSVNSLSYDSTTFGEDPTQEKKVK
jgi:hypothetical protein